VKPELPAASGCESCRRHCAGWHPDLRPLGRGDGYASVVCELKEQSAARSVDAATTSGMKILRNGLKWKPKLALTVVFLRNFSLNESVEILFESVYGGCRPCGLRYSPKLML
jgi:hypothetical protein